MGIRGATGSQLPQACEIGLAEDRTGRVVSVWGEDFDRREVSSCFDVF